MQPNLDKIDDAVLALLHLTSFAQGSGEFAVTRAWKGHDWDALLVKDVIRRAAISSFTG